MQKGFDNLLKIIFATAAGVGILAIVSKFFGYFIFAFVIALLVAVIALVMRRNKALKKEIANHKNNS